MTHHSLTDHQSWTQAPDEVLIEQILFPMIARGIRGMAADPINVMRREHESHGEGLARLRALTGDMTPPDNACNTWRALYLGLEELVTDLMDHIHLENNVLFERIDGRRPAVAKAEEQRDEGTCCGSCGGHSPA